MKQCTACGESKLLSEFRMNGSVPRSMCRLCERKREQERDKTRRQTTERQQYQRAFMSEYRKSNHRKWVSGETKPPQMKRCPKCGETKAYHQFHVATASPDSLAGWCAACMAVSYQDWRDRNP